MTDLIIASRLLWCRGLAQTTGKPEKSVQGWIASAAFAPAVANRELLLTGINEKELTQALGFDINRLSSAACETLRNVFEIASVPKSMGWPYVKLYYSTLFYSHCLLRIWGRSASYFRTTDLLQLRNVLNAYSIITPFPLNTGQYMLVADINNSQAILTPDRGGNGSHDTVWRELAKSFTDLKTAITASQFLHADKQKLNLQIDQALNLLSNGGSNVAWPSFMRNDINYRQSEGVWYPYRGKSRTSDLSNAISQAVLDTYDYTIFLSTTGDELLRFRAACLFIICLVRRIITDLANTGGSKTFLKYGQIQFETAYPQ